MSDRDEAAHRRLEEKRAQLARLLAAEAAQPRTAPLSFAQQRLWFLEQVAPGTGAYNVAQAVRLRGRLDAEALRRSLITIVDRQASLRTTFRAVEGRAQQVVQPASRDPLRLVDLV